MKELVDCSRDKLTPTLPIWFGKFVGHHNKPPIKDEFIEEITAIEFARAVLDSSPRFQEFRQIEPEWFHPHDGQKPNHMINSVVFYMTDGVAYLMTRPFDYFTDVDGYGQMRQTERNIRFWRCGCAHTFTRQDLGNCLHLDTCTKCGFTMQVDSSD